MTKTSANKIRLDLAIPMDLGDMASISNAAGKIAELKAAALAMGFVFTAELTARAGTFDFPAAPEAADGDKPE